MRSTAGGSRRVRCMSEFKVEPEYLIKDERQLRSLFDAQTALAVRKCLRALDRHAQAPAPVRMCSRSRTERSRPRASAAQGLPGSARTRDSQVSLASASRRVPA